MKVYKKFLFQKMSSLGRNMGQNLHLLRGSIPPRAGGNKKAKTVIKKIQIKNKQCLTVRSKQIFLRWALNVRGGMGGTHSSLLPQGI